MYRSVVVYSYYRQAHRDETALYFVNVRDENPLYKDVIKLYMQPQNTNSLIMIEIFLTDDFVTDLLDEHSVPYDSGVANRVQGWFVRYYAPITTSDSLIEPTGISDHAIRHLSKTYNLNGARVTYYFVVELHYSIDNIIIGGGAIAELYFYVIESKTTSDVPSNNSSIQNCLRLEDLNVKFATMPYVICESQDAYRGDIYDIRGYPNIDFYVSFGYAVGPLSASGRLSFGERSGMANTSNVPIPAVISGGGKGTESGVLPSGYYICRTGSYYGIKVHYTDKGYSPRSGTMEVEFDYYVNNMYNYGESYPDSFHDTIPVTVR